MRVRFGEGASVLDLARLGAHQCFPLGLGAQHRRGVRPVLGFDSRPREVPCFGLGLRVRFRRLGRPHLQLVACPRGDRPVLFGARAELRGVPRLLLGPETGLGLARRDRFRFDPGPRFHRCPRFGLGVGLPRAAEVLLEPRAFFLGGANCGVERLPHAQRFERARLDSCALACFVHGGLFDPHERLGERLRDGVGVRALLRGGAGLHLRRCALERDLGGAGLRMDARFRFLQQRRFGLVERRRGRHGGVERRRPFGGTGVEREPNVRWFLDGHGSLRGRRVGLGILNGITGLAARAGFLWGLV